MTHINDTMHASGWVPMRAPDCVPWDVELAWQPHAIGMMARLALRMSYGASQMEFNYVSMATFDTSLINTPILLQLAQHMQLEHPTFRDTQTGQPRLCRCSEDTQLPEWLSNTKEIGFVNESHNESPGLLTSQMYILARSPKSRQGTLVNKTHREAVFNAHRRLVGELARLSNGPDMQLLRNEFRLNEQPAKLLADLTRELYALPEDTRLRDVHSSITLAALTGCEQELDTLHCDTSMLLSHDVNLPVFFGTEFV
jgi:hypothetical protein